MCFEFAEHIYEVYQQEKHEDVESPAATLLGERPVFAEQEPFPVEIAVIHFSFS